MNVLMVASEVAPFSKTGGLADVLGALPPKLEQLGIDVRIVTPMHSSIDFSNHEVTRPTLQSLGVPNGTTEEWCAVHQTHLPNSKVPVYLLEHNRFWRRPSIYQWHGRDYDDNAERFAFLSRAGLQICKLLDWSPDIIHAHDWMTALAPMYLRSFYSTDPVLGGAASVLTIHNVGYQGEFPKIQLSSTGLGWEAFTPAGLEFHDRINYLKAGILASDKVTTVSPRYAWEITTADGGSGLDGILRMRSGDLIGILNGLDYDEWNPATDPHLPVHFDEHQLEGKKECKRALQRELHLPQRDDVPLVAMVSRLAYQKGIDVLAAALPLFMDLDLQFAVLGSGETWAHFVYGDLPNRYPNKAGAYIGFDNGRAHRMYAGSDLFLMPSRYEPCGLGQLSAKRYGSLPIVRRTGGLADTVVSYNEEIGVGDGFVFEDLTARSIANTVGWAVSTWYDRPDHFAAMRRTGMRDRFLWSEAAKRYAEVYRWALERRRAA